MVCPHVQVVAVLGPVNLATTEEVLVEFLSAYAGRGAYLRQEVLKTVRAILGDVHVTVLPQTHESFRKGLDFYASRADKAYRLLDCISMHTMRQMGLTEVLTNDHHFTHERFTISSTVATPGMRARYAPETSGPLPFANSTS
jgi:predicted nucleic acid-binding protein